jgi:hypothetical protein
MCVLVCPKAGRGKVNEGVCSEGVCEGVCPRICVLRTCVVSMFVTLCVLCVHI